MGKLRVALYGRVSTRQHQDTESQEYQLKNWATGHGHDVQGIYLDKGISGAKAKRPGLDALLKAVQLGLVDAVCVTKLSRMFRSTKHMLALVDELEHQGVALVSLGEQIDTQSPQGRMFLTMLAAVDSFERDLIRERIKDGLANAQRKGKKLGRPRIPDSITRRIESLLAAQVSKAEVGRITGVSRGVIIRIEKDLQL